MKLLSVAFSLVFAAGFVQTAAKYCDSKCAACWTIGSTTGEDIKIPCDFGICPDACPTDDYNHMHCAKQSRCV